MKKSKFRNIVLLMLMTIMGIGCMSDAAAKAEMERQKEEARQDSLNKAHKRIDELKEYARQRDMCTDIVIDVDFSIHPGKYRFFVYDCNSYEIRFKGLCAHRSPRWADCMNCAECEDCESVLTPSFSNRVGSHLSSLGHYKVAKKSGYSPNVYDNLCVYGLDETNSNAFRRYIKIHGWYTTPDEEIYPDVMMCSEGCFMLSTNGIKEVISIVEAQNKNVLLYAHK